MNKATCARYVLSIGCVLGVIYMLCSYTYTRAPMVPGFMYVIPGSLYTFSLWTDTRNDIRVHDGTLFMSSQCETFTSNNVACSPQGVYVHVYKKGNPLYIREFSLSDVWTPDLFNDGIMFSLPSVISDTRGRDVLRFKNALGGVACDDVECGFSSREVTIDITMRSFFVAEKVITEKACTSIRHQSDEVCTQYYATSTIPLSYPK